LIFLHIPLLQIFRKNVLQNFYALLSESNF